MPDRTTWDYWWGFNKSQYLNLKANIYSGGASTGQIDWYISKGAHDQASETSKPTEDQIRTIVVPALVQALEEKRGNDLVTGALIALAKIGDKTSESDTSEFEILIKRFLGHGNQEIAETAAIALGILANESSVPTLTGLMLDEDNARALLGRTEVPMRTRAFAAYGLGLIGHRSSDNGLRQEIAGTLVDLLNSPSFATRDLKVAAMTSFGLTPVDPASDSSRSGLVLDSQDLDRTPQGLTGQNNAASRQAQLRFLLHYFDQTEERTYSRSRHAHVRAHAPTAMARLLRDMNPQLDALRAQVLDKILEGVHKHSKYDSAIQQSCVLAIGQLADARGGQGHAHDRARAELVRISISGEQQSKRFALIAMAQAGARPGPSGAPEPTAGRESWRNGITSRLAKAKGEQRAWAGLALGVHARALLDGHQEPFGVDAILALRKEAKRCKTPALAGAYMLGLGLAGDVESAPLILEKLDYFAGSDETRGHAIVALGLMRHTQSTDTIQKVLVQSEFRHGLMKQAAIGLGLLGDKAMVARLVGMLKKADSTTSQAGIASALGVIGDRGSIDGLVDLLQNKKYTQTARGFAAAALGIVCDKAMLPWNSKIGIDINYRATTVTLTGEGKTGILDLL